MYNAFINKYVFYKTFITASGNSTGLFCKYLSILNIAIECMYAIWCTIKINSFNDAVHCWALVSHRRNTTALFKQFRAVGLDLLTFDLTPLRRWRSRRALAAQVSYGCPPETSVFRTIFFDIVQAFLSRSSSCTRSLSTSKQCSPSFFFFGIHYMHSPDCLLLFLSISVFYF